MNIALGSSNSLSITKIIHLNFLQSVVLGTYNRTYTHQPMPRHWIRAIPGGLVRLMVVQVSLTLNQFMHKSGFLVAYVVLFKPGIATPPHPHT